MLKMKSMVLPAIATLALGTGLTQPAKAVDVGGGGVSKKVCLEMGGQWVKILDSFTTTNPDGSTATVYYYRYYCDAR